MNYSIFALRLLISDLWGANGRGVSMRRRIFLWRSARIWEGSRWWLIKTRIECLCIINQKGKKGMWGNISKVENQRTGTHLFSTELIKLPWTTCSTNRGEEIRYRTSTNPWTRQKVIFFPENPTNSRKRRTFKVPSNGEFYRSRSKRQIKPQENLSETEDEVSEDWLMIKHEEVLPPPSCIPSNS